MFQLLLFVSGIGFEENMAIGERRAAMNFFNKRREA